MCVREAVGHSPPTKGGKVKGAAPTSATEPPCLPFVAGEAEAAMAQPIPSLPDYAASVSYWNSRAAMATSRPSAWSWPSA